MHTLQLPRTERTAVVMPGAPTPSVFMNVQSLTGVAQRVTYISRCFSGYWLFCTVLHSCSCHYGIPAAVIMGFLQLLLWHSCSCHYGNTTHYGMLPYACMLIDPLERVPHSLPQRVPLLLPWTLDFQRRLASHVHGLRLSPRRPGSTVSGH